MRSAVNWAYRRPRVPHAATDRRTQIAGNPGLRRGVCFPGLAAEWAKWDGQRPFVGTLTIESPTGADEEVASWILPRPEHRRSASDLAACRWSLRPRHSP